MMGGGVTKLLLLTFQFTLYSYLNINAYIRGLACLLPAKVQHVCGTYYLPARFAPLNVGNFSATQSQRHLRLQQAYITVELATTQPVSGASLTRYLTAAGCALAVPLNQTIESLNNWVCNWRKNCHHHLWRLPLVRVRLSIK